MEQFLICNSAMSIEKRQKQVAQQFGLKQRVLKPSLLLYLKSKCLPPPQILYLIALR